MAREGKAQSGLLSRLFSRLADNRPGVQQAPAAAAKPSIPELKLIFFIVDWSQVQVISGVFEEEKVRFHFISKGMGTQIPKFWTCWVLVRARRRLFCAWNRWCWFLFC